MISDLLKPERTNLGIREDRKRGIYVDGLSEWVVRSPEEVGLSSLNQALAAWRWISVSISQCPLLLASAAVEALQSVQQMLPACRCMD